MKTFIIKVLVFIIMPVLFYFGIGILLKMKFRHTLEEYNAFIFGDSQTVYINSKGTYNLSIFASPYFVHYETPMIVPKHKHA
jgi:hypothetical protein